MRNFNFLLSEIWNFMSLKKIKTRKWYVKLFFLRVFYAANVHDKQLFVYLYFKHEYLNIILISEIHNSKKSINKAIF